MPPPPRLLEVPAEPLPPVPPIPAARASAVCLDGECSSEEEGSWQLQLLDI